MNKANLIDLVSDRASISKNAANTAIDALLEAITGALTGGESVTFVGFGTFDTSHRKKRMGRNPQTGQLMEIPAAVVARFKAGKKLKEAINEANDSE